MEDNKQTGSSTNTGLRNGRPTIGVLISHQTHKNDYSMWQGVVGAARKRDVNVICFVGLWLQSPYGFEAQANVIYDLVSAQRLDGLVVMAGAITQFVPPEEKKAFIERFRPLPIVTLESEVAGTPNIYVDSLLNMRKAVLHLIQTHGYRRIAFIRGPENHKGANDRYRAYLEALAECGIALDTSLVTPPLNWYDGRRGMAWLLDHRVDFEAVIGANDNLAIGAIEELQARGVRIPEQVAVVGYDDAAQSRWISPPLTTVPIETYKWGQHALDMVLALIEGQSVPERVVIPTELVVRQSCGCVDPAVAQAVVEPAGSLSEGSSKRMLLGTAMPDRQEDILAALKQTAAQENLKIEAGQIEQLLDAFVAGLSNASDEVFLQSLDRILRQAIAAGSEIEGWHQVVSTLRRQILSRLHDSQTLLRAENLWQPARVLISKAAQHMLGYREVLAEQRMSVVREIGSALITTFDTEGLMEVLAHQLPRLNIATAYLALYEDPQRPTGPARLLLAYNEQGRIKIEAGGDAFPALQLVPPGLWPRERQYSMVTMPLYFREEQIGFVMFGANPQDGPLYEALREQISSALQGALLVRRVRERSAELARQRYILDSFIENIPDRVYFKDPDSRFTRINKAFALKMRLDAPADGVGKSDFDFFPEEQARFRYEQEQEIIRTGQPVLNLEEPDGTGHWALTTKMPLRDENGHIIGTFGISRDITEIKQAQAAQEQAYAEVERQVQERTAQLQQEVAERRQAQEALQKLNAELDRQVAARTQRLETVAALSGELNAILDLDQLLAELVDQVKERFDYYHAQIYLLDGERKHLTLSASYGEAGTKMRAKGYRVALNSPTGLIPRAAREGVNLLVEDVRQEPTWQACPFLPNTQAELAVPIIAEGEVVGVLDVQSDRVGGLDEGDVSLLHSLANHVGVTLANARMFAAIRRQADQLEALRRVSHDLIALRDLDTLLHQIVERAMQLLSGEGGGIYLHRPKRDALEWAVVVGENPVPLGTTVSRGVGLSGRVWETGQPLIADDYESWAGRMSQITDPIGAALGVPIQRGDSFLGVLLIWTGNRRASLTPEDAALASQFATQAAIAIENARLFEALRVSEEQYALAVRGSNDGIYDWDIANNTLYWSPRLKELLGYADDELEVGFDTFISFLHPDDRERVEAALEAHLKDRAPYEVEERLRTKSGEYRWFYVRGQALWDGDGRPLRMAGSNTDITERKRVEEHLQRAKEELQKQNARLEALYWVGQMINSTLRPDVILDRLTDEAMRVSRATHGQVLVVDEEQGRYERRSLYGFSPEEAERARTVPLPLDRGINGRAYVTRQPVRVDDVRAEPGYFPLIPSTHTELAVPITRDGQVLGNLDLQSPEVGAFRDVDMEYLSALTSHVAIALTNARLYQQAQREIAERTRVEDELRKAKEAAEVAARAKSEFLANMSHEIRTPMNAVIGMAEILSDTELTAEQRECAEIIQTSGDTLLAIIDDILDFSKIESGRLELEQRPFNLRDCLEEALDLLASKAAEKGLEMAYIVDEQTPETLLGDVTRLRQVLMNLLSNAVKFTESGEVVVSVTCSAPTEKQRRVHFAVKDTGIGIPPQYMNRLFRSFSQLDASTTRKYGGTGLGLTISKHLSELMGGTMWAESDGVPGHGSTFHFTILAEVSARQELTYLHGPQPALAGKRILIVDDNATNRHILSRQSRTWGMVPHEAATGREALAWIRDGEPFDVAILDMHMPEMDGLALAAEMRTYRDARTLPLVMLTSLGQAREISRNGGSELAACLTKPVKSAQLYDILAHVLGGQMLPAREHAARPYIDPHMGQRYPLRILLAEDNAANQKVALSQLKKMDYRADVVANGVEVLEALERQAYDLVLMDVQMPEVDGLEATRRIRERWPGERAPRIIAVTASTMQEDRERCFEAGMDDYISKPVRIEELTGVLRRCQPVAQAGDMPPRQSAKPEQNGKALASAETATPPTRGTPLYAVAAIDTAVLEDLSAGMEEIVPELIGLYFDSAPNLLADLRQAIAQEDGGLLFRAAHTLKPTSATLGAIALATLCEELEHMGRVGALEGAVEKLAQVEAEYQRVKVALEAIR
jgi:PAS domain S-box-containing protein